MFSIIKFKKTIGKKLQTDYRETFKSIFREASDTHERQARKPSMAADLTYAAFMKNSSLAWEGQD